ncbi:alpha/beta hydrolase [Algoriphagus aquimarinus]|uniref:Alpha/beta hydrolase n=1 Tax=Algoriphagus aquimarinus TaxID=237018 RepID=A0A5C7ARY9_9BACT|nr:alpha/beta hydrolase [Algoriphagus aquimarinus]TXE11430.1 alpha/beta hydrolase [Algoriphagus aquimarinus]
MRWYGISGLGADKRVFSRLTLDFELISIEWIQPLKNESIEDYSIRLSHSIDQSIEFGLLAVSFGGLIAVEISKKLNPIMTVLISSAETKQELRPIFRGIGKTRLVTLLPNLFFDPPRKLAHFIFGTNQKELLNSILDDTDLNFAKWAVNELLNWKNTQQLEQVLKISGTNDKLIPPSKDEKIQLINGGEHFMIFDRAEEISKIINEGFKLNRSLK